jgi:XTP/dITP diphosphohydrolase
VEPIVVATRNRHKLSELRQILDDYELEALPEALIPPPEVGSTFAENALGKARWARRKLGKAVIGEDSGIEARALGGRPGVRSARFAGEDSTDEQNLQRLLDELDGVEDRSVAYVCALVHIDADGLETLVEGRCEGWAARTPSGEGGFGYDPIFVPADIDDGRTAAELSAEEKHAISHRGRAARELKARLSG